MRDAAEPRFNGPLAQFKVQSSRFKVQGSRFKVQGGGAAVQRAFGPVQGSRFSDLKVQSDPRVDDKVAERL